MTTTSLSTSERPAPADSSLSTSAARAIATTTKTRPFALGMSPRWLMRNLPWVEVEGGTYRVNRRLRDSHTGGGREAPIKIASGHVGEPDLPGTFPDYDPTPREYPLSLAQAVLRVHRRVSDVHNQPMDQAKQQLQLTIQALEERQEYDILNSPEFGLLANVAPEQAIRTRHGPPGPDDLDELLCRRRKARFYVAHPRAIAAFGRECSKRGVYSPGVTRTVDGKEVTFHAWRGVPILPCDKIPISEKWTTSILILRTGESDRGVIGLRKADVTDDSDIDWEGAPGVGIRQMDVNDKAIGEYLVSMYFSVAVLVPDALGVLQGVQL